MLYKPVFLHRWSSWIPRGVQIRGCISCRGICYPFPDVWTSTTCCWWNCSCATSICCGMPSSRFLMYFVHASNMSWDICWDHGDVSFFFVLYSSLCLCFSLVVLTIFPSFFLFRFWSLQKDTKVSAEEVERREKIREQRRQRFREMFAQKRATKVPLVSPSTHTHTIFWQYCGFVYNCWISLLWISSQLLCPQIQKLEERNSLLRHVFELKEELQGSDVRVRLIFLGFFRDRNSSFIFFFL